MRKNLLFSILFIILSFDSLGQKTNEIKLQIIGQETVLNKGNNYWANREVTLRLINTSQTTIYVKGYKSIDNKYHPFGLYIKFDRFRRKWVTPLNQTSIPKFSELDSEDTNYITINPKESLIFSDLLEDSALKNKYKRVIYVSFQDSKANPEIILSQEFILESSNYLK